LRGADQGLSGRRCVRCRGLGELSQAQIRLIETRAKLGGHAPTRTTEVLPREKYSIAIHFSSGHSEEISVLPSPTTIEGEMLDQDNEQLNC
jgi:hypothetical protein